MRYAHIKNNSEYNARFLDTEGDGSGSIAMNVNGATTPILFKITAGVGETILLHRLLVHVGDTGSFDSGKYGNGLTLLNGIEVGIMRGGEVVNDLTYQHPIITNADWAAYCYDVSILGWGQGDEYMAVRWTFEKDGAVLVLREGDTFFVKIADDISTLSNHHCRIGMVSLKH